MVEVTLEDVVIRVPKHEEVRWLAEGKDYKLGWTRVLLLRERAGERVLPIWVGPSEGDVIAMSLVGLASFRPMPWDLLARLLDLGTMRLEKVVVNSLRDNTFIGSLWISVDGTSHEIDARPSDAITLALQVGAPIFVADEVFDSPQAHVLRVGAELPGLEAVHQRSVSEGKAEPDPVDKEFRSFRSLPRHEHKFVRQRAK